MSDITFFGQTNFRNMQRKFGIKLDDRRRHFYAIGKTGMGKSEMLKNMAIQDIQRGHGIGFVDPHGESVEDLLNFIPQERIQDVVYFNPADNEYPIAFNVMEEVDPEKRHLVASGLMSVFKKIWPDVWSARMEYILNYAILALLEYPGATLLGINRMLSDIEYRQKVVEAVKDPVVKTFWMQEYARYTQRYEIEATAAIQNKVGQFISTPLVRNIVGQQHSNINLRELMDKRKILLVNLSKGRIGEDNSRLLGGLLVTKIQLAAMSRVDIPEEERNDFFFYIDEFQNFATESFATILSEARKYRLSLVLSHQYIAQLEEEVADAVFGNVGTLVSFRIGAEDAEAFEKEFFPEFLATDFVNLGKYTIYVKLMIDGVASRPFSATTLAPMPRPAVSFRDKIIQSSREKYGTAVEKVDTLIREWAGISAGGSAPGPAPLGGNGAFSAPGGNMGGGPQILYDAICDRCKKPAKVIFPPDGKRPVYCKKCRKKLKQAQKKDEEGEIEKTPSASEEKTPVATAPVSVSLRDVLARQPASEMPKKDAARMEPQQNIPRAGGVLKDALRKALKDAVAGNAPKKETAKQQKEDAKQTGVLKPGETIYFQNP